MCDHTSHPPFDFVEPSYAPLVCTKHSTRIRGSFLCIFRGSPVFYFGGGCRGLFYVPAWYHVAHASTPFVVVYTFGTARGVSCCRLPGSFLLISLGTPVLSFGGGCRCIFYDRTARGVSCCTLPGSFFFISLGTPVIFFGAGCRGLFNLLAWVRT